MARFASITMSMRDIDRVKVVQAIVDGYLKASTAANRLRLTKCLGMSQEKPAGLLRRAGLGNLMLVL